MKLLPVACLCLLTLSANAVTVVVQEDSDAILPCSLSTKEDISFKLFDWTKAAQKGERQEVFFYDSGPKYNNGKEGQNEQFKGRVFHFQEELKHGNASIIIRNTTLADSGTYTCVFPKLQPQPQIFHIELIVGASPKPTVTIVGPTEDGALLECEVLGAFPKPELQWRDSAGNNLTAGEPQVTERKEKDATRYDVTLQITVTRADTFNCVATQLEIYHQSKPAYTYVPISAAGRPESTMMVVAAVLGSLLLWSF